MLKSSADKLGENNARRLLKTVPDLRGGLGGTCPPEEAASALKKKKKKKKEEKNTFFVHYMILRVYILKRKSFATLTKMLFPSF